VPVGEYWQTPRNLKMWLSNLYTLDVDALINAASLKCTQLKKQTPYSMSITSRNIDRFLKFFHC